MSLMLHGYLLCLLLFFISPSFATECNYVDWARVPVKDLVTKYKHCFVTEPSKTNRTGLFNKYGRRKRSIEQQPIDPILLHCFQQYCSDVGFMPIGLNISCNVPSLGLSINNPDLKKLVINHCATKFISPGASHFAVNNPKDNHARDNVLAADIGPFASNPTNLHGRYARCNSTNPYQGSWTLDNCKIVANSLVNTIYMTPSDFNNIKSSTVFTPNLSNRQCPELAPLKDSSFEISSDSSFDVVAYLPVSMAAMNRASARSCSYHLCDICVVEIPLKFTGSCTIQTYKRKVIEQVLCNNSSRTIGYLIHALHNSPHFTNRLKTSRFILPQIFYFAEYISGHTWLTSPRPNQELYGQIAPSDCVKIDIEYPEDLHVHVTTKCGVGPVLLSEQLSTYDYCHNYFASYYASVIFTMLCTYWLIFRIIFVVAAVYVLYYVLSKLKLKDLLLSPIMCVSSVLSYLLYLIVPASCTCNKCHSIWTPYHDCDKYCMCGGLATVYHDCLYYPKLYDLENSEAVPKISKIEMFKTFFNYHNPTTRKITSFTYFIMIYVIACLIIPSAHGHNCCGHDVDDSMRSKSDDGLCHLSHDYSQIVFETPTDSKYCKINNVLPNMTESSLIENSCGDIQKSCKPAQILLTIKYLNLDPFTVITQCLIIGTSPYFDSKFISHCTNSATILSIYEAAQSVHRSELVKHRLKPRTPNMVPSQFKLMLESLPNGKLRGLPASIAHNEIDFSSNYLYFRSDTTSQGFISNFRLSASSGAGVVLTAVIDDNHSAFELKVHVDAVKTVHKLKYMYTSCPSRISSNMSWSCWDSETACRDNIRGIVNPTCFHHSTPTSRWSILPRCTIFTSGHVCSSCTVRPALDRCLDVYSQEYSHTEVDICFNVFSVYKCTTLTSKDSINRQFISMHTYGVDDTELSEKIVLSGKGECLHGSVNNLYESDDLFGTPQYEKNGTLLSSNCDFHPSYEWNDNFEVDFEKCVGDTYYKHKSLMKCGHTIIDEQHNIAYIDTRNTLPVELSMTLPPSTVQILNAPKDVRLNSCSCYGCISCSEGYHCNVSISSQSKGTVGISIDSGLSTPNQVYLMQGTTISSLKINTKSDSKNPTIRVSHSGMELVHSTCKVNIVKAAGRVGDFHSTPLLKNSVPISENLSGWLGSHIGYLNPLNWGIGLSAWFMAWLHWIAFASLLVLVIAAVYYWSMTKLASLEKKII